MKKIFATFTLVFVLLVNICFAQWELQDIGIGYQGKLTDVFFINDSVGFIVGDYGYIGKTTDGGITWEEKGILYTNDFYSVYFENQNTGYVTGNNIILKTNNGGYTWEDLSGNVPYNYLNGQIFLSQQDTNLWLIGNTGTDIYDRSLAIDIYDNSLIYDLPPRTRRFKVINDTLTLYVIKSGMDYIWGCNELARWKTIDLGGGMTQNTLETIISTSTEGSFEDMIFLNDSIGFLVGYDNWHSGLILQTLDMGMTWDTIYTEYIGFYGMCLINDSIGFVYGESDITSGILKSIDGLQSWNIETANYPYMAYYPTIRAMTCKNGICYAVGNSISMDPIILKNSCSQDIEYIHNNKIEIFTNHNIINIIDNSIDTKHIKVLSMTGSILYETTSNQLNTKICINANSNIYIVTVIKKNLTYSKKILIIK